MNSADSKNYFLHENGSVTGELFKLAIKFAERCETVLYFRSEPLNKLPEIEKPEKDILNKIIFMYCGDIQQLTAKLLDLHTWCLAPRLIIIDSLHEFTSSSQREIEIEKYALIISSLFNCVQFLKKRLNGECTSVVSFDINISNVDWKLLIDLYYYKTTISEITSVIGYSA